MNFLIILLLLTRAFSVHDKIPNDFFYINFKRFNSTKVLYTTLCSDQLKYIFELKIFYLIDSRLNKIKIKY